MGKFETITDARNLLELTETATMDQIKTSYVT